MSKVGIVRVVNFEFHFRGGGGGGIVLEHNMQ